MVSAPSFEAWSQLPSIANVNRSILNTPNHLPSDILHLSLVVDIFVASKPHFDAKVDVFEDFFASRCHGCRGTRHTRTSDPTLTNSSPINRDWAVISDFPGILYPMSWPTITRSLDDVPIFFCPSVSSKNTQTPNRRTGTYEDLFRPTFKGVP